MKRKYCKEVVEIIRASITAGETYRQAMTRAGIAESTFQEWKHRYPEFAAMLKEAETNHRLSKAYEAEVGLHRAACGYETTEIRTEYEIGKHGHPVIKRQIKTTRTVPPNVLACKMELMNLAPEKWGKDPEEGQSPLVRVEVVSSEAQQGENGNKNDEDIHRD